MYLFLDTAIGGDILLLYFTDEHANTPTKHIFRASERISVTELPSGLRNFSFLRNRKVTPSLKGLCAMFSLPFLMDSQKTENIMLQLKTQFKHVQLDFPFKLEVFQARWIWLQLKQQ